MLGCEQASGTADKAVQEQLLPLWSCWYYVSCARNAPTELRLSMPHAHAPCLTPCNTAGRWSIKDCNTSQSRSTGVLQARGKHSGPWSGLSAPTQQLADSLQLL